MIINDLFNNKKQGVAEGSGQKPTITYKDYTLQYDYQTEDDDPEGYSTATTYYFDVFKDGKRVGEAEYFDYFGDLTIRINGKTQKFEHQHPLASKVSQLVSSLPDEQKRDLSDPKFESQGVAEGPVTKKPQPYNDPDWIKKLPKDQLDALGGQRYSKDKKPVSEVNLGDYRKKAAVSQASAKMDRFFGRDDPAKVAAADRTIAKRTQGLARADARTKPYTPPPHDAEKYQRELTAKYPNIDELVRKAELDRDPNYEMADGEAYYRGRDAEQNYQRLRQIQRVIQGLNESLNRSHLP